MKHLRPLITSLVTCLAIGAAAKTVAHFDMQVKSGCITETVSGLTFPVEGNFEPENTEGAVGTALRFDGYTSHVTAA